MVTQGGLYALLAGYATAQALQDGGIQAAQVIKPRATRHIFLALARAGEVNLAVRTVMQEAQAVAQQIALGVKS